MGRTEEKISASELEVMKALWEAGEALPLTELRQRLQSRLDWSDATVKTLLRRLCEKGAVEQEKRKVFFYRAAVSREDYSGWAAKTLVDKLFRGSARDLVTALVKSDGLSERDLAELRELFRVEGD
ncbi:MAG: BlaI/MecI/CopY family transcriptional regulator [Oscillospiraceae bacterium]|nr:BlaI/MecI/CopY family transcriptional regulator [Oscillospiraceae bacterium]